MEAGPENSVQTRYFWLPSPSVSCYHFQALGLVSFLQSHFPGKLLLKEGSKVWRVSRLKWNKTTKVSVLQGEEKPLVHFCWDFCSKHLPCQTSLIKHKTWSVPSFFSKCSKSLDRFWTNNNNVIHQKVPEDAECLIQRQSSILVLDSLEVGWNRDMEKGAHWQTQKYSSEMQRIRKPTGAQTGKRCQD